MVMFLGKICYGKGIMSETPTLPPQSSEQYQIPQPDRANENDADFGNSFVGHSISEEARRARDFIERTETQPVPVPQPEVLTPSTDTKRLSTGAKLGIAAGAVAGAALVAQSVGGLLPASEQAPQPEVAPAVESLVQASYDADAYIGDFEITSGVAVIDQAEAAIKESVGEQAWQDARADKYTLLLDSAKSINTLFPAPGTKTYVVQLELDNNPDNGDEFIVTLGAPQGVHNADGTIPSPEQAD